MHSGSLQLALISSAFNLAVNFDLVSRCDIPPPGDGRRRAEGNCPGQLSIGGPAGSHCEEQKTASQAL